MKKKPKKPTPPRPYRVSLAHEVTFYSEVEVMASSPSEARRKACAETCEELDWNTSSQDDPRVIECILA